LYPTAPKPRTNPSSAKHIKSLAEVHSVPTIPSRFLLAARPHFPERFKFPVAESSCIFTYRHEVFGFNLLNLLINPRGISDKDLTGFENLSGLHLATSFVELDPNKIS